VKKIKTLFNKLLVSFDVIRLLMTVLALVSFYLLFSRTVAARSIHRFFAE
jgi:hypothetical protein